MRSQYLLLGICSAGCAATISASQASGQKGQELQQVLIDPQVEGKMQPQERPAKISIEQMYAKLSEAKHKFDGGAAEQQQAAQIYQAIVNIATKYATAAQTEGKKHNELDMIASTALNNLGNCYESGKGVKQDKHHAFELYAQAVALGELTKWWNYQALYNLARCYEKGIGTKQDSAESTKLLSKAYEWYNNFVKLYPMYPDKAFGQGVKQALEARKKTEEGQKRSVCISIQNEEEPIELAPISYQKFED